MKISLYNTQKTVKISTKSLKKAVLAILQYLKVPCDEIAVHLVSKKKICDLHDQFFNDPSPTDCISFPSKKPPSGYYFFGDIFVSPIAAKEFVEKSGGSLYEELTLYLIHGLLHLNGYDDIKPHDRKTMRRKEKELMLFLKKENCLISP